VAFTEATNRAAAAAATDALDGAAMKSMLVGLKRQVNSTLDRAIHKAETAATWQGLSPSSTGASSTSMRGSSSDFAVPSEPSGSGEEHRLEPDEDDDNASKPYMHHDSSPPDVGDIISRPKPTGAYGLVGAETCLA
jgi:hypothetical protein